MSAARVLHSSPWLELACPENAASTGIDSCVDVTGPLGGRCMALLLTDIDPEANHAVFALLSINDVAAGGDYTFAQPGNSPIQLIPMVSLRVLASARAEANAGRDLSYPGASVAAQQRKAYPDLAPLHIQVVPVVTFQRARKAAADLGWQTTGIDRLDHTFEATDVTRVFRFVDDIVVRVRATGATSVVDVRSKSRDGRGDMGANAARIRAFLAAMEKDSG